MDESWEPPEFDAEERLLDGAFDVARDRASIRHLFMDWCCLYCGIDQLEAQEEPCIPHRPTSYTTQSEE